MSEEEKPTEELVEQILTYSVEDLIEEVHDLEDACDVYSLRIEELEKEAVRLRNENEVLRKEIEASYKHNETINKWWKFKLERLELSQSHASTPTEGEKPWIHYNK